MKNSTKHTCDKCGGRLALIKGVFCYEADCEPYESGVEEDVIANDGDCHVLGFKCDDCGNVQDLWTE